MLGQVLLVDHSKTTRLFVGNGLEAAGFQVKAVGDGESALRHVQSDSVDVVVCDLQIEDMDGFQLLARIRELDPTLAIVTTTDDPDPAIVLRAVREGAFDCVNKKGADRRHLFTAVERGVAHGKLLRENIRLNLELEVRLAELAEQQTLAESERQAAVTARQTAETERKRAETLLRKLLPAAIADRLKGEITNFAETFDDVTVLFADIAGFSRLSAGRAPAALVEVLGEMFDRFDELAERHGVEKIKTMGDGYMAAAGVPLQQMDHAQVVAEMALGMIEAVRPRAEASAGSFGIRIGIASGPVIAGVIGKKRPIYDLWGDTVNVASRMETHGTIGRVHVSPSTYNLLAPYYDFTERGLVNLKNIGDTRTWFLDRRKLRSSGRIVSPK